MSIFDFTDYKAFVRETLGVDAPRGRGQFRRLAQALKISTTMVSQVFNGPKNLSMEMASDLCDYLELNERESEYLLLLISCAKTSHHKLQQKYLARVKKLRIEAKNLDSLLPKDRVLSEADKTVFYSNWIYTGARQLAALPTVNSLDDLAARLNLSRRQVQRVVEFLLATGLCVEKKGKLEVGPQRTHVGADSPHVARHHQNWRLNAMSIMGVHRDDNLFYTGPMSLSTATADKVRQELVRMIEKMNAWVHPSPSEVVRCLNIDWFEF